MRVKNISLLGLGLLIVAAIAWWRFSSQREEGGSPAKSARIGTILADISAPVLLAQRLGYFTDENLKVDIVPFETGAQATVALLEGRLDFVTAAEYVFVLKAFKHETLRILAVVGTGDFTEVIARSDAGINRPQDLRGKRIAVSRGTHADYFLGRFLTVHGLLPGEVRLIDTKPSEESQALATGQVDAAVAWEPHLSAIKDQIPGEAISWRLKDHDFYWLLLSREETLRRGDVQDRILRALVKADAYLESNTTDGRQLVSQIVGEDDRSPHVWERYYFELNLPQPLLSVMEDEARWAIENRLTDADRVPNYLDYLDLSSLRRINERAVTVIQ